MSELLAYVGAAIVALWGVMHAIPTRSVVSGFGPLSADNQRVITQEWVAEALTMWFIAAIVVITTVMAGSLAGITVWIDRTSALMLIGLAILTAVTGARTTVIWFKICPVLLTIAAVMLLLASWL
jgi:hypothetical protein